jgi:ornithine cyclodeaminase/alanine dehydrogenase-like protein (mu-crystallin family)
MDGLRYLTYGDLQQLGVTAGRIAQVLQEAFACKAAGGVVSPPMTFFHRGQSNWFNSMVCWIPSLGYAGCKFQSGDAGNPSRGLPSIQGLYLLCECEGGRMVALIDSRWLTAMRTAAVGELFARREARSSATWIGILGCGLQGRLQLEAIRSAVPTLARCKAYDTNAAVAAEYKLAMEQQHGIPVEIAPSAEQAVRGMDIVMSSGPIQKVRSQAIQPDWLAPGCLYVSLDRDSYISDAAVRSFDLVLSDDREALFHAKEHENAFHAVERVDADLADIACGPAATRASDAQRVAVFVNGLGIEDLAAAVEVYRVAQARGAGMVLPPQWQAGTAGAGQ